MQKHHIFYANVLLFKCNSIIFVLLIYKLINKDRKSYQNRKAKDQMINTFQPNNPIRSGIKKQKKLIPETNTNILFKMKAKHILCIWVISTCFCWVHWTVFLFCAYMFFYVGKNSRRLMRELDYEDEDDEFL